MQSKIARFCLLFASLLSFPTLALSQGYSTDKTIFNDIWNPTSHVLNFAASSSNTPNIVPQSLQTILNDVWDSTNHILKTNIDKGGLLFNVKAYGAYGDSTLAGAGTDDTTAIQAAITAACATTPVGGIVYFPAGYYKITSAVSITCNNLTFIGTGSRSSMLVQATASTAGISNNGTRHFNIAMRDIGVTCSSAVLCTTGIDWTDVSDSIMDNVEVYVDSGSATVGVFTTGIAIYTTTGKGAYRDHLYRVVVRTRTHATAVALDLDGVSQSESANSTHVYGGAFRADSGTSIYAHKGDQIVIMGVTLEGSPAQCAKFSGDSSTSTSNMFAFNRMEGCTSGLLFDATTVGNMAMGNSYTSGMTNKVQDLGTRNFVIEPNASGGNKFIMSRGDFETDSGAFIGGITNQAFQARSATTQTSGLWFAKANGRMGFGDGAGSEDVLFTRAARGAAYLETGVFGWKVTDSPTTCSSTIKGTVYADSSLNEVCYCDGSTWNLVSRPWVTGSNTSCGTTVSTLKPGNPTVSVTGTGTGADVTEDTLWTTTTPASHFNADGKAIRVKFMGRFAANGNNKTVTAYFGASTCSIPANATNNGHWQIEYVVYRTGSNTQHMECVADYGVDDMSTVTRRGRARSATETDSGAITVKVTGQNGTANASDVTFIAGSIEALN